MIAKKQTRTAETDQEIMARLREPIDDLIEQYRSEMDDFQRFRLRQLAWQSVDVLARTGDVSGLKNNPNIKRIIGDIRQIGASDEFIEKSLNLAITIYRKMEIEYPALLNRYRS